MNYSDYEKLGALYLGKGYDQPRAELQEAPLLYDAKDLTTHAVIVGMTGSGKTGLGVDLLEEAALDGVPSIVLDPKGDMGNLLLSFPKLRPSDFEPWVDPGEATRKGRSLSEHARATAELWSGGLSEWGQDGERIQRFRNAVDLAIYTPGSAAGLPLSVLRSFDAPAPAVLNDPDALHERTESAISGLLALLGIRADPVQSREHILLSNLVLRAWRNGRGLDLGRLIQEIQKPPFEKLGVLDIETFYPSKDRTALALKLNALLASPGFAAWMEGDPLNAGSLLFQPDGRPRISVISIAHLGESERMFVVTMVLNEVVSWMRSQSGTSSLRALLYMDEIFGFFPPSATPPSKKPMLTLLKQARAYGLGVVLATQNPVDLDYKGLSNCGTWFIGRLQTERDKKRVLDGLQGASTEAGQNLDSKVLRKSIGALGKRVFLMNNVHEDGPAVFQTRWAMSYLRGPLVRDQIRKLMAGRKKEAAKTAVQPGAAAASAPAAAPSEHAITTRPVLPEGLAESFLPLAEEPAEGQPLVYRISVIATAQLHFKRTGLGIDQWKDVTLVASLAADGTASWSGATVHDGSGPKTHKRPRGGASFEDVPPTLLRKRSIASLSKKLVAELYRSQAVTVLSYKPGKLRSNWGESESNFRQRLTLQLTEERDRSVEKLRAKYASDAESLETRIRRAEEKVELEKSQLQEKRLQSAVSFGASVLGALMGRKKLSVTNVGRAGRAVRSVGRSRKEKADVGRAEERLEDLLERKRELEDELQRELDGLHSRAPAAADAQIDSQRLPPLKTDISVDRLAVLWTPWGVAPDGGAERLAPN